MCPVAPTFVTSGFLEKKLITIFLQTGITFEPVGIKKAIISRKIAYSIRYKLYLYDFGKKIIVGDVKDL